MILLLWIAICPPALPAALNSSVNALPEMTYFLSCKLKEAIQGFRTPDFADLCCKAILDLGMPNGDFQ